MCSVGTPAADKEDSWSGVIIGILCVIGIVGILKMIYDILSAYWELRVSQAAAKLCRTRVSAPAADEDLGQVPSLERSNGHEDDLGSLADMDFPRVSLGQPVAASVARPAAHVQEEPMYVRESSTSTRGVFLENNGEKVTPSLPSEVYLFPSGEVYHTEKSCHHVTGNAHKPLTRRACRKCLDIAQRRTPCNSMTQRSETG